MNFDRINSPRVRRFACSLFATAVLVCAVASADDSETKAIDAQGIEFFEQHIRPILKRRCYQCHSHKSGKAKGGLVLDSRGGWEKGGSSGPAIAAGKPDESLLIEAVRYLSLEMPPKQKLPDSEIGLLVKWIAMGAPDPRKSMQPTIDPEKLWALQPIQEPAVPAVADTNWPRDEIDAFLLARLEQEGLKPAPSADRYSLLRRVTFDLTGLPPTPESITVFINDSSDLAYENVVDRLLDSTALGDHWARHWFDLSCYADLADINGDVLIRDAWRYRDYVIAALNADKPLDRFIHEQIAGDLLPYESAQQQREQIIATGFLAIGPWTLQNYIKGQLDADVVDHQIDRIGRIFLGQTITCARCHDHKFDPVPTRDYYALAGIFHSTLTTSYDGPGVWSQITHVTLPDPGVTPEELAERNKTLEELSARRQILQAELTSLFLKINHSHAVDLGEGDYAVQLFGGSTPSLASAKPVSEKEKQAHARAVKLEQEVQSLVSRIAELEEMNAPQKAIAVRDVDSPDDSPIYIRGNFQSLGETAPRGFLSAVPVSTSYQIPPESSGRRQLAQWLTDRGNTLTTRVLVNRIWHHLFGQGLVRSVDYFGVHGETPSHPELLDFLALRLREEDGWSLKKTVRRMVMSRAYQMSSAHNPAAAAVDPDNRLLWQMPRRRLTAESIRDAMLAASGQLDPARGGSPLGLELKGNIRGAGGTVNPATWGGKIAESVKNRRSIYLPLMRKRPLGELEILSAFDFPHPSEITGARSETTVATQALFLMNSPLVKDQANKLAQRLAKEAADDQRARINRLYLLTVNRPAEVDEIETALTFLDHCAEDLTSNHSSDHEKARSEAWAQLCHAVLGSNTFLFRE